MVYYHLYMIKIIMWGYTDTPFSDPVTNSLKSELVVLLDPIHKGTHEPHELRDWKKVTRYDSVLRAASYDWMRSS